MVQDIFPHVLNNQYDINAVPSENDYVLLVDGYKIASSVEGSIEFPKYSQFTDISESALTYLFSLDDTKFFLGNTDMELPVNFAFYDVKELREKGLGPKEMIFAAITAKHLADWYRDVAYCGRCGNKMSHSKTERAMTCSCGYTTYPRIMPAVIVGVTNGNKLLLTKYRTGYQHNALIAGFTEIGETLEETVAREVMEEAGVKVKNIRYYKSQPWGVANDILMGYYCDVDGDDTIKMDESELKYAAWVDREDIILQPDDFSLTNEMMMQFKDGLQ